MKRLVYILPAVLMTACFAQQAPKPETPKVIRAQRFELTDAQGNTRAVMGMSDDGQATLRMLDKEGKTAVQIDGDGNVVILRSGKPKVVVGTTGSDYGVGVYDAEGEFRGGLTMLDDEPMLTMLDSKGGFRVQLFLGKEEPYFSLSDGTKAGAYVSLAVKGTSPRMLIKDGNGKARAEWSLADGGAPRLLMANSAGDSCVDILVSNDLPSIQLTNPQTKSLSWMGFTKDADLALTFQGADSKVLAGMTLTATEKPVIYVQHASGMPSASMGLMDGAGYVMTTDKSGGMKWESPE